jgi:hypothetical protein
LGEKLSPVFTAAGQLVGERYRVEHSLGHGGMARVYRALDERSGQYVALKQLSIEEDRPAAAQAMFEREYHTLVQLAHPHIVRAFDYGLDPSGPFYTMELLSGADARETTRNGPALSVQQICLLLHDAASALALIHSRRMLHRDLSPRNLFCDVHGRGKLIDFGSLASMGAQATSAGTPPLVPPEVVHIQALDARSDLYALGALAYYMLVQKHAYPARQVRELRELWQHRPQAPDALRDDVPRALSDLVMSLLSLDPRGRPSSAGEVCERLCAIFALPVSDERRVAQAFLSTPTLVGREHAQAQVAARLQRLRRGRGGTLVIVGEPGIGRSRMLENVVLDAKVAGPCAALVPATRAQSIDYGLATLIAERVVEALPALPALEDKHAATLAALSPSLRRALGREGAAGSMPTKNAIEAACLELVRLSAIEQPFVLAIDDIQRSDGATLGLLGQLTAQARELRVLLVVTTTLSTHGDEAPAVEHLVRPEHRIDLERLDMEETRALLGSLFGVVSGLDEAARFLYEVSQGSPQVCMQYAQFLVDQGLARYEGGAWKLPERLRDHALPASLAAMLERRISVLGEDAAEVALALALSRDETRGAWQPERRVHIEDVGKLLGGTSKAHTARAFDALDELRRAGLVEQRERDYVLAQGATADALLRTADKDARARAHRRLAEVFTRNGNTDGYVVARHLQLAGDYPAAQRALLALLGAGSWNWGAMRVSLYTKCAESQLEYWQATRGTVRDGLGLRRLVVISASVWDWSNARVGDALLEQLLSDIGFTHWDATDATLPTEARLALCMQNAERAYAACPEAQRGLLPRAAADELAECAMPLSGAYVNSHDLPRARVLAQGFSRLRTLSPLHALLADLCDLAVDRITGRAAGERVVACIARLYEATTLPDVLRLGGAAVYMHIQSLADARLGRKRALDLMDFLALSVGGSMFIVVHARYLAFAFAGQALQARRWRKQLELTTSDDIWRRRAYLFVEAELHALTGNLAELNATTAAIAELAAKFEGWRPHLSYCRAHAHRLRGELDAALAVIDQALSAVAPDTHRTYAPLVLARAEVLLAQRKPEAALQVARGLCVVIETHGLERSFLITAARLQSLALSAQEEHEAAHEQLKSAFALAREHEQAGLPLAVLYEAQARLSIAANEPREGLKALSILRDYLERAEAPALIGAYEQLRVENQRQLHGSMQPAPESAESARPLPIVSQIQSATSSVESSVGSSSDQVDTSSAGLGPRANRETFDHGKKV